MTLLLFTNKEPNTAVFLLAHSGEKHIRSGESQKAETSKNRSATMSEFQHEKPVEVTRPSSSHIELVPVVSDQETLASSVMGLPFGLGELSLGLILVGPVCLSAVRRWLHS